MKHHSNNSNNSITRFDRIDFMGEGFVLVDNIKEWVYQHDGVPLICDGCRKHVRYDYKESMFYCSDPSEENNNFNQRKGFN